MQDLIEQFETIRDLPYAIPIEENDPNLSCSGKVWRLKKAFSEHGINCRYRVCEFFWSDLNLPQPLLKKIVINKGVHVYLEVSLKDKWLKLDPSWDKPLHKIFKIAYWNGKNTPPLAVKPIKTYTLERSLQIMENPVSKAAKDHHQQNKSFHQSFNMWLKEFR